MAVEVSRYGTITITGDDIHKYRILALRSAMALALKGIKVVRGRSVFAIVKQEFGLTGNNKSVYAQFCDMHQLHFDPSKGPTCAAPASASESSTTPTPRTLDPEDSRPSSTSKVE